MRLGIEIWLLIVIGVLFIIEQFFYLALGSYPYRVGIVIKTITIPDFSTVIQRKENNLKNRLAIKKNNKKQETYVRYKYPPTIIGPLLFIGQIKENKLMIRIGPISAIFILSLIAVPILFYGLNGLLNVLVLIALIFWLYYRFYTLIPSC